MSVLRSAPECRMRQPFCGIAPARFQQQSERDMSAALEAHLNPDFRSFLRILDYVYAAGCAETSWDRPVAAAVSAAVRSPASTHSSDGPSSAPATG